jgi:nucleotide-binding universal stress UspA family protein
MNLDKAPVHHVLVAHDLGPDSEAALDYAVALARPLGARITVLHAYEIPSLIPPEMLVPPNDWFAPLREAAQHGLDGVVDRVKAAGVEVASELRLGVAWREVEAAVKENDVDLVVVGSHGRRGLPRALLGSVAEKIVRTAACPVLVVRRPDKES